MAQKAEKKLIAQNKKAFHDYFVDERYEAGIELLGTEVKSIRRGAVNLKDSYCQVKKGELFAVGMHISPYEQGNIFNHDPLRSRKLLLHKKEIQWFANQTKKGGFTIVPTKVYFRKGKAKVEIALAKGKHDYDKRETIKKRDIERDMRNGD